MNEINLDYIVEGIRHLAVPIDDVHLDSANARTKHAIDRIATSLKLYKQRKPIIVNRLQNGKIEAGNGTWLAAKQLGWTHIAVIYVDDDAATAAAFGITDNRLGDLSEWDKDALGTIISSLDDLFTGFTAGELRDVLGTRGEGLLTDPGAEVEDSQLIALQEKWGTAPNQIWQLGRHTLVCTDVTALNVESLGWRSLAALTITSPPYWVGKDYEEQKSEAEIDQFIKQVAAVIADVTRVDESRIVINTSTGFTTSFEKRKKRQVLLLIDKWTDSFFELGWNLRHVRHWLKEGQLVSVSPKTDLIDQHTEFFATYEHDEGKPMQFDDVLNENDIHLLGVFYNRYGKNRGQEKTNQNWALRAYWADIKGAAGSHGHTAAFPVEIPARHVLLYTKPDEIVFDSCSGVGTTLISCEILNRVAICTEKDPRHIAATLERWHMMTGLMPERIKA